MKSFVKTETGCLVMKGGKAWGVVYEDGRSRAEGWTDPTTVPLSNPRYVTKPSDLTYKGSPNTKELNTGVVVKVKKTTTVEIV